MTVFFVFSKVCVFGANTHSNTSVLKCIQRYMFLFPKEKFRYTETQLYKLSLSQLLIQFRHNIWKIINKNFPQHQIIWYPTFFTT